MQTASEVNIPRGGAPANGSQSPDAIADNFLAVASERRGREHGIQQSLARYIPLPQAMAWNTDRAAVGTTDARHGSVGSGRVEPQRIADGAALRAGDKLCERTLLYKSGREAGLEVSR